MSNLMDTRLLLVFGQRSNIRPQVIDRIGNNVGQAGRQRPDNHIGKSGLLLGQRCIFTAARVNGIDRWKVPFDPVSQRCNFRIPITDRLKRLNLIIDLEPFVSIKPLQSTRLLFVQVVQQRLIGSRFIGVNDRPGL